MLGADGIAVGLSTAILPHNFIELLEAQIAIIQKRPFKLYPDFQTGGTMDITEYADGVGRIKVRAEIEPRGTNKLVITSLPWTQTTESLISNIEDAIRRKKVPVREISDFTSSKVEIELTLTTGAAQEQATKALYAFTTCETSISSRPVVLFRNRPTEMAVSDILRSNTEQLMELLQRELIIRQGELDDLFHSKTLEQIFIENRIYKRIEEEVTYEAVQQAVLEGFKPFRKMLRRDVSLDDVEALLQIKIRRISRFDINKNREEIEAIIREEGEVSENLQNLRTYTINFLKELIKQYKKTYPRLTHVVENPFAAIEVRELTASELTLKIDKDNGYIGTEIRGGEELFKCSSLDKIIVVWDDGRFKMMPPPDKFFFDKDVTYIQIYDREKIFTAVYTEPEYGFTYIKRFPFGGLIQNKDYRLAPEKSKLRLFEEGTPESVFLKYKPSKSQRIHQQEFSLLPAKINGQLDDPVKVRGVTAKGLQMTSKDISCIATKKPAWWDDNEKSPKGSLA